jgi:hypothetical protein
MLVDNINKKGFDISSLMKLPLNITFVLLTITMTIVICGGASGKMKTGKLDLPKTVGVWNRLEPSRIINSDNIFKYMNGAGELYLGYRFRHIEVFDYTSADQGNILVELYFMESSDDAFGLLSLDWGGEPVSLNGAPAAASNQTFTAPSRALYGGGLLRLWSDNIYARIMAERETPASKEAVLGLGKAIAAGAQYSPEPALVKLLPLGIDAVWKLRVDRLSFFRSNLVLNSIYYLSHENILDLDLSAKAVSAPYQTIPGSGDSQRSQFLLVQYESIERARQALIRFLDAYLTGHEQEKPVQTATSSPGLFKLEDGWMAYKLIGRHIAIVFEGPDPESARPSFRKMNPIC